MGVHVGREGKGHRQYMLRKYSIFFVGTSFVHGTTGIVVHFWYMAVHRRQVGDDGLSASIFVGVHDLLQSFLCTGKA